MSQYRRKTKKAKEDFTETVRSIVPKLIPFFSALSQQRLDKTT